jgi:hypothetical protein
LNIRKVSGFPIKPPILSPKARLNPTTNQTIEMIPKRIKLCSMVDTRFLYLTIPPKKKANQGYIRNTRADAINIHAVSA